MLYSKGEQCKPGTLGKQCKPDTLVPLPTPEPNGAKFIYLKTIYLATNYREETPGLFGMEHKSHEQMMPWYGLRVNGFQI